MCVQRKNAVSVFLLIPDFFLRQPWCLSFFFQPAFFMYDASVFFTARVGMSVPCESTAHSHDCSCHDCTAYSHDSPQTPRLRSITTILLNFSILHIWVHLQLSLPPHAKLLLERDHVQSILLEPTMASDPQSAPQPRLQP